MVGGRRFGSIGLAMSSLLQFNGDVGKRGVELAFERYGKHPPYGPHGPTELDPRVLCTICDKEHIQIGLAWRKPVGMLGCWVQFRYLGGLHAPDLSVPISVLDWPRGTRILDAEENSKYWHRED